MTSTLNQPRPPCGAPVLKPGFDVGVCARPEGHDGIHSERLRPGEMTVRRGPGPDDEEVRMGVSDGYCDTVVYGPDGSSLCGLPRGHLGPCARAIAPGMARTDRSVDYETARPRMTRCRYRGVEGDQCTEAVETHADVHLWNDADRAKWEDPAFGLADPVPTVGPADPGPVHYTRVEVGPSADLLAFMGRMAEVLDPVWTSDDPLPSEDRLVHMAAKMRETASRGLALKRRIRDAMDGRIDTRPGHD